MSSLTLDTYFSLNNSSQRFFVKAKFMLMFDSNLGRGFSLINSSQGISMEESSMFDSAPDEGSLNFSQYGSKEKGFI